MKTLQEYYDFFSKIPEEEWVCGSLETSGGKYCAIGHMEEQEYVHFRERVG